MSDKKPAIRPLLTPEQTAQILAITTDRLGHMRYHSQGPDYVTVGRSIRYSQDAVDDYIRSNTVSTTRCAPRVGEGAA